MAIVWSILLSLGSVLLCSGLCYALFTMLPLSPKVTHSGTLGVATLVGFWGGYAVMYQQLLPAFPPLDVSLWWVYSLPILVVLAYWPSAVLSVLLSGGYAFLLTGPLRQYEWSLIQAFCFSLAVAVIMGLLPLGVNRVLDTSRFAEKEALVGLWPWVMGVTSLGSAGIFVLSSSASLAQQALFLTVAQALWGMRLFFRRLPIAERAHIKGLVIVNVWLLLMLWLNMLVFASLSYVALVGLLALFSPLLLRVKPLAKASFFRQCLTVTLGSGLCLSLAIICVFLFQPQAGVYY
jgi:hypothetical protein